MPEISHGGARIRVIRIVDGRPEVAEDDWQVLAAGGAWDGRPHRLFALRDALAHPERLAAAGGEVGIWLAPDQDPAEAVPLFGSLAMIGVDFPEFTDGRGYSTAALLRTRHGWRGGLRALGDVLQDQLFYLRRVGFDSFALRADRDPHQALRAFSTFSGAYQSSVIPVPAAG